MSPGGRRLVSALVILTCACEAASAVTPRFQHHWRRRAQVPPLPYPELLHPQDQPLLPSGFTMTVVRDQTGEAADPQAEIARPRDIATQLAACWNPPPDDGGTPSEVTIRVQFARSGLPIGVPAVTYVRAAQGARERQAVVDSIRSALKACTPLRFTGGLGAAIAGYPFAIRFVARAPANQKP